MDNTYLKFTWWFEKDWTFRVREANKKPKQSKAVNLGIPKNIEAAEEYKYEEFKGPIITLHDKDDNVWGLAMDSVLLDPKKNPKDYHPVWKKLFGKGIVAGKTLVDCARKSRLVR